MNNILLAHCPGTPEFAARQAKIAKEEADMKQPFIDKINQLEEKLKELENQRDQERTNERQRKQIRQQDNRTQVSLLLEIATSEVYKLANGYARVKGHRNLNQLMEIEATYLNQGAFGRKMFTTNNRLLKPADELDVACLCHILKNSPSLALQSDPAWLKTSGGLPFVGANHIEASTIVEEIWSKIHCHSNGISAIDETTFIVHACRLLKNIHVLGFDSIDNEINSRYSLNTSHLLATASVIRKNSMERENVFGERSIRQKLSDIFFINSSIDVKLYVAHLRLLRILDEDDAEDIDGKRSKTERQLALVDAIKLKGKVGVDALYKKAKEKNHYDFAENLKEQFGFDD